MRVRSAPLAPPASRLGGFLPHLPFDRPCRRKEESPACSLLSSSVFIPSLKPFTVPPRSVPRLRSFFVPKIRTTTSNTISQCQMLNEPDVFLLHSSISSAAKSPRSRHEARTAASGAARVLLLDSGDAFAPREFRKHVVGLQVTPRKQHHAMEPQVRRLAYHVQFITPLRGEQGLGGLLGDLLEDRILPVRRQSRDKGMLTDRPEAAMRSRSKGVGGCPDRS